MIEIDALTKSFTQASGETVAALRGVSLVIPPGQFVAVIGSNGSGKSTLLNAVAGTFIPDTGQIRIVGRDVTTLPTHRRAGRIGRVFQDPFKGSCPSMTVAENLRLADLRGQRRRLRIGLGRLERMRYRDLLASLGMRLETRLDAVMGTLSGGQRQAITLLMATIRRPDLLLLDEHTAALDPRAADLVMEVTDRLVRQERLTTLMVTHSMDQALEHGDRTIMMHRGEVIADLTGEALAGATEADLLQRFAELRYTAEVKLTAELRRPDAPGIPPSD